MNLLQNQKTIRWERIDGQKIYEKTNGSNVVFITLILVEVQVNDVVPTSSHPLFSVPPPFSFKLDNSHVSFYTCLDESIRICVNLNKKVKIDLFAECIRLSYHYCLADLIMHRQDPKWQKAKQSYHYCFEQHKSLIHFASCLLEWFETEMY